MSIYWNILEYCILSFLRYPNGAMHISTETEMNQCVNPPKKNRQQNILLWYQPIPRSAVNILEQHTLCSFNIASELATIFHWDPSPIVWFHFLSIFHKFPGGISKKPSLECLETAKFMCPLWNWCGFEFQPLLWNLSYNPFFFLRAVATLHKNLRWLENRLCICIYIPVYIYIYTYVYANISIVLGNQFSQQVLVCPLAAIICHG